MKVKYKNIGLIAEAEIGLNGITVIAAPNNSGKSFLVKTFYMFLETLINFKEEFSYFRSLSIRGELQDFVRAINKNFAPSQMQNFVELLYNSENYDFSKIFIYDEEEAKLDYTFYPLVRFKFDKVIFESIKEAYIDVIDEGEELIFLERILSLYSQSEGEMFSVSVRSKLRSYFDNDLISNGEEESIFNLADDSSVLLETSFSNTSLKKLNFQDSLNKFSNILYFDSFINLENYRFDNLYSLGENNTLRSKSDKKFWQMIDSREELNPLREDIELQDRMLLRVGEIISGTVEKDGRDIRFNRDGQSYSLKNTATGIKIFGALQLLLNSYKMTSDLFLVIDEPETNLHPVWQVKLAEIIVLLNKELGVQFVINSHSSNFIEGVKLYSELYECEQATSFYLINTEQYGRHIVENVSHNIQLAYDQLNGSLDILDEVAERILVKSQGES